MTWTPPQPPTVFADFFDGRGAGVQRVAVEVDGAALTITPPEAAPEVWPTSSLREVPDQAHLGALILTSEQRGLARLIVTDPRMIRSIRHFARRLSDKPPVRGKGRVLGWAAAAVASVFAIVFVLVPILADQLARVLPPEGEQALGEATLEQIQTALGDDFLPLDFCWTPEGQDALDAMQARLGIDALDLPYPVNVSVLDHGMVNAFALPGGQVIFFRGMIEAAENPDQIAAVLAHEVGHVAARDPTRIALRSAGSLGVLGLLFGDFAGGAAVLFLVEQMIQADYSREAEAAADAFGTDMLIAAGISPAALADLFQILLDEYGDAEGIAAHFMSHPALGDRIATARAAGATVPDPRPALDAAEWAALQRMCD